MDFTANAISFPNSFACSTGGGKSYGADCPASSTVTIKAGYTSIQEVYQTGNLITTQAKTIDNTKAFDYNPEIGCFMFDLYNVANNTVVPPSCILIDPDSLTTTIGVGVTPCTTSITTAPEEIV